MTSAASRHPYGVLLSRLAWPTAILFAGILTALIATVVWTSDSANETAAERQRLQMIAAVEQRLGDLRTRLQHLVASAAVTDLIQHQASPELLFWLFAQRAQQYFEFSGAFIITPDLTDEFLAGDKAYHRIRPFVEDIVVAARADLARAQGGADPAYRPTMTEHKLRVDRLVSDGIRTYAITALSLHPGRTDGTGGCDQGGYRGRLQGVHPGGPADARRSACREQPVPVAAAARPGLDRGAAL